MDKQDKTYCQYIEILKKELIPAMGCTEPIAVAYCAAMARSVLGRMPVRTELIVSGNIIKNVKSVIVPNTGGARGLEAAAGIGIVAGKEELGVGSAVPGNRITAERICQMDENSRFFNRAGRGRQAAEHYGTIVG